MASGVVAEVVEAFEINDVANDVYQHNFGHRPHQVSTPSKLGTLCLFCCFTAHNMRLINCKACNFVLDDASLYDFSSDFICA